MPTERKCTVVIGRMTKKEEAMVCGKCGQECADDVKFCTSCGAELTESAEVVAEEPAEAKSEVVEERKKIPRKWLLRMK